jgi:hypothetical protein
MWELPLVRVEPVNLARHSSLAYIGIAQLQEANKAERRARREGFDHHGLTGTSANSEVFIGRPYLTEMVSMPKAIFSFGPDTVCARIQFFWRSHIARFVKSAKN